MTATDTANPSSNLADPLGVADVGWNLQPLIGEGEPAVRVEALLDEADALATLMERHRGTVAALDGAGLAVVMREMEQLTVLLERAGTYTFLNYATDVADPASGAAVARLQERGTAIGTKVLFIDLEWAGVADDSHAEAVLAHPDLSFCAHYLRVARQARPYLLSEAEERLSAEKNVTGAAAWSRLFDEQVSAISVAIGGDLGDVPLDVALAELQHPDADRRKHAATKISEAIEPGLRTRAYIYNVLLADKSTDDRLRSYPSWVSSRNLANQASDASVRALVDTVTDRFDIPQRWYRLKAKLLGVDQLMWFDRNASLPVGDVAQTSWTEAKAIVLDAYNSFSPNIAARAQAFFDDRRIDAPPRTSKQGGAFCAPTFPGVEPYVLVNYTGARHDVLTLAHELGHGVHFSLSGSRNSVFQLQTPLTVAETASVFGETVTLGRLLADESDPRRRLALLATSMDGAVATVFRQVAMWRFEDLCHRARRTDGELSVEALAANWMQCQAQLFGETVDATGYDHWWSYIHHFIHTPGYVYAYAFGQLLAMSVYDRYRQTGPSFVPHYEEMLAAGGSRSPEALAAMVGCDLTDPGFWSAGLDLIDSTLREAEAAAQALGH